MQNVKTILEKSRAFEIDKKIIPIKEIINLIKMIKIKSLINTLKKNNSNFLLEFLIVF